MSLSTEFDSMIRDRAQSEQRQLFLEYLYELTIEARDLSNLAQLKGLYEVVHTIVGVLLRATLGDDWLIGDILGDYGRIYEIERNLSQACARVGKRHPRP